MASVTMKPGFHIHPNESNEMVVLVKRTIEESFAAVLEFQSFLPSIFRRYEGELVNGTAGTVGAKYSFIQTKLQANGTVRIHHEFIIQEIQQNKLIRLNHSYSCDSKQKEHNGTNKVMEILFVATNGGTLISLLSTQNPLPKALGCCLPCIQICVNNSEQTAHVLRDFAKYINEYSVGSNSVVPIAQVVPQQAMAK